MQCSGLRQILRCGMVVVLLLGVGCPLVKPVKTIFDKEAAARNALRAAPIALFGEVHSPDGAALSGVAVRSGDVATLTGLDGTFAFDALPRGNVLLTIDAGDGHLEQVPVCLAQPIEVATVQLDAIVLAPPTPETVRFLFGGDTAFGRRFLDVDESTPRDEVPPDDPLALIRASDPEPGTQDALKGILPLYREADWGVVNLETPVTLNPATPHQEKDFAYFTLPGSLPALREIGVDYVSLGNNHVYDYLDAGLVDTLQHLDEAGIVYSGGGLSVSEAFAPFRKELKRQAYSFLSMTLVGGGQHAISYVAEASKGGGCGLACGRGRAGGTRRRGAGRLRRNRAVAWREGIHLRAQQLYARQN